MQPYGQTGYISGIILDDGADHLYHILHFAQLEAFNYILSIDWQRDTSRCELY